MSKFKDDSTVVFNSGFYQHVGKISENIEEEFYAIRSYCGEVYKMRSSGYEVASSQSLRALKAEATTSAKPGSKTPAHVMRTPGLLRVRPTNVSLCPMCLAKIK